MSKPLRIAIVAGEASGDILGAGLISEIKKSIPSSEFFGVGGENMLALGFESWYPMDRLSVMGLIEPFKRIFELLAMRKSIRDRLIADPPDVFVGIDSPDFNLGLELKLREQGVKVVHYVSPSVWAWRQGRIKKIARAVDLILALFPFEEDFYLRHKVPVKCVGHTLADIIPLSVDRVGARTEINALLQENALEDHDQILGILPGSRASEVRLHTRLFLLAANKIYQNNKQLKFLIPAANQQRYDEINAVIKEFSQLPIKLVLKHSHEAMAASNVLLIASGTTALEAMLLKKPSVISYKMSGLAFKIIKSMATIEFVGLPNLLANRELMPELLQDEATPEKLAASIEKLLHVDNTLLIEEFNKMHQYLRRDANKSAADAVIGFIETNSHEP